MAAAAVLVLLVLLVVVAAAGLGTCMWAIVHGSHLQVCFGDVSGMLQVCFGVQL